MIWLNTYWTWQYFVMLAFVFTTAAILAKIFFAKCSNWKYRTDTIVAVIWAALTTFFLHQVWWLP